MPTQLDRPSHYQTPNEEKNLFHATWANPRALDTMISRVLDRPTRVELRGLVENFEAQKRDHGETLAAKIALTALLTRFTRQCLHKNWSGIIYESDEDDSD